jgi:hypothetical protein
MNSIPACVDLITDLLIGRGLPSEVYIITVPSLSSSLLEVIDPVAASVLEVLGNVGLNSCNVNLISEHIRAL